MKKLAPHDSSVKPLDAVPAEEIWLAPELYWTLDKPYI